MAFNRTPSLSGQWTSNEDQNADFLLHNHDDQDVLEMAYKDFDTAAALYGEEHQHYRVVENGAVGKVQWVVDVDGRIIIKFYYPIRGNEIFHISSFTQNGRFGGIHIAWPDRHARKGKSYIFLRHEWIFNYLGVGWTRNGALQIVEKLLTLLIHYFRTNQRSSQPGVAITDGLLLAFMASCRRRGPLADNNPNILALLNESRRRISNWEPHSYGGSTKIILYLVKIKKLRELNKKLRKNKTKNKNKIEKNKKRIDELKNKIKKQKKKEKVKKQKEKLKLKQLKQKLKLKKVQKKTKKTKKNKK